mgnify:CR=1 FL=1
MTAGWKLAALFAGLIAVSLALGAARLDQDALWLLAVSRLPRTVAAMLAGAALAVAGVIAIVINRPRLVSLKQG